MAFVILSAPLSGCLGGESKEASAEDLQVGPETLISGVFQRVTFDAAMDMSIFIPYLIIDPSNSFVQNSTVIDVQGTFTLEILAPPRVSSLVFLVGELGREIGL